jgi:hypothetical protein
MFLVFSMPVKKPAQGGSFVNVMVSQEGFSDLLTVAKWLSPDRVKLSTGRSSPVPCLSSYKATSNGTGDRESCQNLYYILCL